MPITVVLPQPSGTIGPGADISWTSDFIGPLETSAYVNIALAQDADFTEAVWTNAIKAFGPGGHFIVGGNTPDKIIAYQPILGTFSQTDGTNAYLRIQLYDSIEALEPVDSGSFAIPWNNTQTLSALITNLAEIPPVTLSTSDTASLDAIQTGVTDIQTGITSTLSQIGGDVTATLGQLFSQSTIDRLTLAEATSGPTGEPVRVLINDFFFGVIVRVTTIPTGLLPHTPDDSWYYPDLAVLRFIRGVDTLARIPIHQTNQLVWNPPLWGFAWMNTNPLFFPPPQINIAVDWMPGAEGQLFFLTLP